MVVRLGIGSAGQCRRIGPVEATGRVQLFNNPRRKMAGLCSAHGWLIFYDMMGIMIRVMSSFGSAPCARAHVHRCTGKAIQSGVGKERMNTDEFSVTFVFTMYTMQRKRNFPQCPDSL